MKSETKLILNNWINFLGEKFWESEGLSKIGLQLSQEFNQYKCYPESKDIFKAFNLTQPENLTGICIGLDPYDKELATGISFGIDITKMVRVPPSLEKIHKAIENECHNGMLIEFDYSLEYLCKQGLLMLNSSLTLRSGFTGSHNYIWNDFMKIFLSATTCKKENLVIFLIGKVAQELQQYISKEGNHKVYLLEHPSYAARQNRDWETKGILKETNGIIKW